MFVTIYTSYFLISINVLTSVYMSHDELQGLGPRLYCMVFTLQILFLHIDIDECSEQLGSCTQTCENTDGGYICKCEAGYTKMMDGATCKKRDGKWRL